GAKLHHPAVYALLQEYLFPDEFVRASAEPITTILADHCHSVFGLAEAECLVAASRQAVARPIGREAVRSLVHAHIADITTFQERKAHYLKTGYALVKDRTEAKLLRTVKGGGVSNTLALVSECGDVHRFASGDHLASFL